jgi:RNA polymerase sigma-70 factor, ECF subfamily
MTDAELIERASAGDPPAARTLYQRYAPRVYAVVRRIAGDDDLAEDCAQEAWIRVFRALPTFRGDARFSTWIHRIAVNSTLQGLRKVRRREVRREPLPEVIPVDPERKDPLLASRLERALDQVPEGMRRVLVLHDVEGYTHQDIGELLGINPGTSKSQLFKARAKMREILMDGIREDGRADGEDPSADRGGLEAWNI